MEKDKYKELGLEFENEDEVEEDADEEGVDLVKAEREHFEETD